MRRNETAVLQFGATSAALKGKGATNVRHFRALDVPVGKVFAAKMSSYDTARRKRAAYRKTDAFKEKERIRRGQVFSNHATALASSEVALYRKGAFNDHRYAKSVQLSEK